MERELIKIQSADGKAIKTIAKSEYSLYAQSGWKVIDKAKSPTTTGTYNPYNSTVNK